MQCSPALVVKLVRIANVSNANIHTRVRSARGAARNCRVPGRCGESVREAYATASGARWKLAMNASAASPGTKK
jgi:hypothetical protein